LINSKTIDLIEANEEGMVFTFGRFSPPHSGHELLINKVTSVAKKLGYEHGIYASKSHDKNKNPLKYNDKIKFMKSSFKKANIVKDSSLINPFFVAKKLSDQGYKNVVLVVGGDRAADLEREIRKYIGHKDPKKSFNFDSFRVVSAGKRDPDADDVTGMSASKMRMLASEGDFDNFKAGTPSDMSARDAKKMYDLIRKEMDVSESLSTFLDRMDIDTPENIFEQEALTTLSNEDLVMLGLMEQEDKPSIIVLTKYDDGDLSDTTEKMGKSCKKMGLNFYPVSIDDAYIVDKDVDDSQVVIHNYDGGGKKITLDTSNSVCVPRGSVLTNHSGVGILSVVQDTDIFTVNKLSSMELCNNKLATAIVLERNKIASPKTALVNNEESVDIALEKIGGEFPVIIKTITGAEGIGVSLIESRESLLGVLQSLWKFNAEVIMQEYFEIDHDIRSIVMDGEIIASSKRLKGDGDFRTNKSLGNDTEPYSLSEEEKTLILKAARASGCYLCGVDHIENSEGKYLVLEINASPGSGAEPFMGYEDGEESEISGQEMVDRVISHISDKSNWQATLKDIGSVEEVSIEGIGSMDARVDTGNEGYNVLHATDIDTENGEVRFVTDTGVQMSLPKRGTVTINVGSGVREDRPVVEIDMSMGRKKYKNVKFSLADRNENDFPVLIGMKFLKDHNFRVDVSTKNILEAFDIYREYK